MENKPASESVGVYVALVGMAVSLAAFMAVRSEQKSTEKSLEELRSQYEEATVRANAYEQVLETCLRNRGCREALEAMPAYEGGVVVSGTRAVTVECARGVGGGENNQEHSFYWFTTGYTYGSRGIAGLNGHPTIRERPVSDASECKEKWLLEKLRVE